MPTFEPVLLKNRGVAGAETLATYRARGGYAAAEKAVKELTPDAVVQIVKDSGLRGRGGAGFPCGTKWSLLPANRTATVLCVNADESEPGTFNNRILMEADPHQVIEGIVIACHAVRASRAFLYIRYEFDRAYRRLRQAIAEAREAGILGERACGVGGPLDIQLHRGAGAYICGEETGLLESLEGRRAWPRIKPPFPTQAGAFGLPTVVNNIETLCCLVPIIERGVSWFRSIGVPADPNNPRDLGSYGPKLYCVSGHVERPGCYELPLGVSCGELIENHAGGVWRGRRAKAAIPGGLSMGLLRADEFDTPLDFNGPGRRGCLGLGTAAVVVMDEATPIIDFLYNACRFFHHESCGQCTPCREGTGWMFKIVDRIRRGGGRAEDLEHLAAVASGIGIMPGTTICGLADGAAWPVKCALAKFRPELEERVARRPAGAEAVTTH